MYITVTETKELCFEELKQEVWSGAVDTLKTIEEFNKEDELLDLINEMFDCDVNIEWQATSSLATYIGKRIGHKTVISEPDRYGFFTVEYDWGDTELWCLCNEIDIPSLYRGNL